MRVLSVCVLALLLSAVAFAQVPPSPTQAGTLSEVERLKHENLQLQSQLAQLLAQKSDCEAQLGPLRAQAHNQALAAQATALKEQIEQAHPGYTFDVQTGKLTKKPAEQKPEE